MQCYQLLEKSNNEELATLSKPPKCHIERLCYHKKTRDFLTVSFKSANRFLGIFFFSFRNHYHCHLLSFGRRHLNFWYQTSWKHTLNFTVWAERKKVSELLKKYLSLKNTLLFTLHIKLDVIDYFSSTLEKSANFNWKPWFLPELSRSHQTFFNKK